MNNICLSSDNVASPHWRGEVTSAHFRNRAKHYRCAAVMSDDLQKRRMFNDLAFMFEQMAHGFGRFETQKRRPPGAHQI
jgi:hypothetical protein